MAALQLLISFRVWEEKFFLLLNGFQAKHQLTFISFCWGF